MATGSTSGATTSSAFLPLATEQDGDLRHRTPAACNTARDAWVYDFVEAARRRNVRRSDRLHTTIRVSQRHALRDRSTIRRGSSWSSGLERNGRDARGSDGRRASIERSVRARYRPFSRQHGLLRRGAQRRPVAYRGFPLRPTVIRTWHLLRRSTVGSRLLGADDRSRARPASDWRWQPGQFFARWRYEPTSRTARSTSAARARSSTATAGSTTSPTRR